MKKQDYYWYWLNNIPGIGRITIHKLLDTFKKPEEIYRANQTEIRRFLPGDKQMEAFMASQNKEAIIKSYQRLEKKKVRFLHPESGEYPERLRTIPDAPAGLYLKGELPPENRKSVAIIGARQCSRYGTEMARFMGRELSACGISVISGLARGIDGMAHTGALEAEGYTLGILGCGIDRVYPEENYQLFMKMEKKGGILSENNIGVAPVAGLFPQRNRLIAGMADGILVVEAMEKSGTFITVDQGLEQGKEIFAVPGRIVDAKSAGCNHLIKLGAHMVTEIGDILEVLHMEHKYVPKRNDFGSREENVKKNLLAPIEKMVYSCLRIEPKYLDEIIEEARIAPQEVCMALNRLVISGVIVETARNYYAIKL